MTGMRGGLAELIEQEQVDTVLCVLTDLWGRLVGKRLTGGTFYDTFLRRDGRTGELGASLYLFCVDLDMEPLDGFALTGFFLANRVFEPRGLAASDTRERFLK